MAHDDDKPDAGDDPWAGLEADGLPELSGDFAFAFDDEPASESQAEDVDAAAVDAGDALLDDADAADAFAALDAPLDASLDAPLDAPFADAADQWDAPDAADGADAADEPAVLAFVEASDDEPVIPIAAAGEPDDPFADVSAAGAEAEATAGGVASEPAAVDEAAIDAWLTDADDAGGAAESSVFPFDVVAETQPDDAELSGVIGAASNVDIGTGNSGIISPSGIEAAGEEEEAGMFAFAAESSSADEPMTDEPIADAFGVVDEAAADEFSVADAVLVAGDATGGAAAAADVRPSKRPAAARRKKPSVVGQLVGVIVGGALAIPITLGILIWGFGKDPFGLTPLVPESLSFMLPAKFQPGGGLGGDAIDLAGAPSLDAVVADAQAADGDESEPTDLAADEAPASDAEPADETSPMPEPGEPGQTALAAVDATPGSDSDEATADPLMDLLNEEEGDRDAANESEPAIAAAPPAPPAPPEPEPLELTDLDAAVAAATAGLEGIAAAADPVDADRRRRVGRCYFKLAAYAQELASLEALAVETGRPFGPAAERAADLRAALAGHPELFEDLASVTRDWLTYSRRDSEGLMVPATFVESRRVGPYWRSRVTLPATGSRPAADLAVLTRAEPTVAPGETVLVTGLILDDDAIWAVEVAPIESSDDGFPGL